MTDTDPQERCGDRITRAEAQRSLEMLNREVGVPLPQPEPTAAEPPEGETRVKLSGAVDQGGGGIKVFAEISERVGSAAKDIGILPGDPQRPPGKIDAFAAVCRRVLCPSDNVENLVAMRRQGKGRTVTRIAFDRLSKQFQRPLDPSPAGFVKRQGAQIEIVGSEIARRPFRRPPDFRGLQRRFDDPGDTRCDLVL